jgi:hypothetical protein
MAKPFPRLSVQVASEDFFFKKKGASEEWRHKQG